MTKVQTRDYLMYKLVNKASYVINHMHRDVTHEMKT